MDSEADPPTGGDLLDTGRRGGALVETTVVHWDGEATERVDTVAVEEPLEVRLATAGAPATPLPVVMRTPGDDVDLAWGLALTGGHRRRPPGRAGRLQRRRATTGPGVARPDLSRRRPWLSTAACGLCGEDSVAAIAVSSTPLGGIGPPVDMDRLIALPERLRRGQQVSDRTGGLHAAGAFRPDGEPICVREDIGRHSAVDKVVGHLARAGLLPGHDLTMVVSGRPGFEVVHKTAAAGVPVVVAVSVPSQLSVSLARTLGMTLAGFVRNGAANIYSGVERMGR